MQRCYYSIEYFMLWRSAMPPSSIFYYYAVIFMHETVLLYVQCHMCSYNIISFYIIKRNLLLSELPSQNSHGCHLFSLMDKQKLVLFTHMRLQLVVWRMRRLFFNVVVPIMPNNLYIPTLFGTFQEFYLYSTNAGLLGY